jgi:hypothetical protein
MSTQSDEERPASHLRCHQPHQTPGEGFLQCLAREVLYVGRMQRHDPAGVVDSPGARAAAGSDRRAEGILQGAAVKGRIDAGLGDGLGRRQVRPADPPPATDQYGREPASGDPAADRRE